MKYIFYVAMAVLTLTACKSSKTEPATGKRPVEYVNPFIGTDAHGHTFPGAAAPFGMVQLSPDTRTDSWDGCSGYHYSDSVILGFSHTHLSGTGCGDYGDLRFMPATGVLKLDAGEHEADGYKSTFRKENEKASAGYYSVVLDEYNTKVELTAGLRFGMQRYTFPQTADAHVVFDLAHSIVTERIHGLELNVEGNSAISGLRRSGSWADDQYLYFYAEFSKPFKSWGCRTNNMIKTKSPVSGNDLVAYFDFDASDGEPVIIKIGISAVDIEGAKNNLLSECTGFDFDAQVTKAKEMWNNELKRFEVTDKDEDAKTVFYTAYYHCLVSPNLYSDADGRFRNHALKVEKSQSRRYTVFSLWDTFRALHPLYNIIQRERSLEIINTFLNNYQTGGLLPVWELAANETNCMIGYHAIPVIVDAWQNGIRDFDAELALEAMIASATHPHFGVDSYMKYGYIPAEAEGESVSKTLEYAYDDWCIAHFAEMLGKQDIASAFYQRAQSYKNIFDAQTGFMRGRSNGGFVSPFDPTQVNFMLTEANTWQYNFFVPQDVNTHIDILGGERAYERKLDELFQGSSELTGRNQADITGLIGQYAHGNEPSHHMAQLYNFVGKPIKCQKIINTIMDDFYTNAPDGLIGNEDCGQMSAWYVMNSLGFYPVTPGIGYYVIGAPQFGRIKMNLENGKTFEVVANNLSDENRYIKSVKLNGKKLNRSYIYYDEIAKGGTLAFEMTSNRESTWGTEKEVRPVARIATNQIVRTPIITSESKTFYDNMTVTVEQAEGNKITIVKNGDTIADKSLAKSVLVLDATANITAWSENAEGIRSNVVEATFVKIPKGRTITLKNAYNDQYAAGGQIALIDQLRGGNNFRTGTWQGYDGVDLDATVDLGSVQNVHRVAGSFLQEERSWIFMPREVEFYSSTDNRNWTMVARVKNKILPNTEGALTQELGFTRDMKARYVRMIARNIGECPQWHVGAGYPAWIFCDEFIVE